MTRSAEGQPSRITDMRAGARLKPAAEGALVTCTERG